MKLRLCLLPMSHEISSPHRTIIMRPIFLLTRTTLVFRTSRTATKSRCQAFPNWIATNSTNRTFHSSRRLQNASSPSETGNPHRNFYKTHGRALFKALTLAFLTYQVVYWAWLTLETEEIKDQTNREIKGLESEAKMLDEGRKSHLPGNPIREKMAEGRES